MKRILVMCVAFALTTGLLSAEISTLIDFNDLTDDSEGQNAATILDYSSLANRGSFTEEDRPKLRSSLFIGNWTAQLNSSARNADSVRFTTVKPVFSNELQKTVLALRTFFPSSVGFNANVTIKPPFTIPAAMPAFPNDPNETVEGGLNAFQNNRFDGKGIIKNVGVLKSITMKTRGMQYPHKVSLLLANFDGKITEVPMGNVRADGWVDLKWNNVDYIFDVRNTDIKVSAIYPVSVPLVRLAGIKFYRDGQDVGEDFVAYISDIIVEYDQAKRTDLPVDIEDEVTWQILFDREQARAQKELASFAEVQLHEFNLRALMDKNPTSYPIGAKIPVNTVNTNPGSAAPATQVGENPAQ